MWTSRQSRPGAAIALAVTTGTSYDPRPAVTRRLPTDVPAATACGDTLARRWDRTAMTERFTASRY